MLNKANSLLSFGNIELSRNGNKSVVIRMSRNLTACKAVSRNYEVKRCTGSREYSPGILGKLPWLEKPA